MRRRRAAALSITLLWSAACASSATTQAAGATGAPAQGTESSAEVDYELLVADPERTEADRELDAGRKPAQTLRFMGVRPGMRVAEISAGGGYTAELLARAVGPEGRVYGVNSPFVLQRFAEKPWSERLAKEVMGNVERLDRELDDPFPPELQGLDLVVNVLFYHDTFWMELDRDAMNRAVFDALAPGGTYVVIDHASADEMADGETKSLHRVGEKRVRQEIERVGFRFVESADFLRNPEDARDWNAAPSAAGERRGTSDRFALKFVKPAQ